MIDLLIKAVIAVVLVIIILILLITAWALFDILHALVTTRKIKKAAESGA